MQLPAVTLASTPSTGLGHWGHLYSICFGAFTRVLYTQEELCHVDWVAKLVLAQVNGNSAVGGDFPA